jgi:transposase-like protein
VCRVLRRRQTFAAPETATLGWHGGARVSRVYAEKKGQVIGLAEWAGFCESCTSGNFDWLPANTAALSHRRNACYIKPSLLRHPVRQGEDRWESFGIFVGSTRSVLMSRMQTQLPKEGLSRYISNAQRARVSTEMWASASLYCPNCESANLRSLPVNTPARDYVCPRCASPFQLKAQSRPFTRRIVDAAYSAMVRAIREDSTPNLFALQYDVSSWTVVNIILIPHFAFPLSAIEKRRPLSPTARRAGWVGCNILLDAIPPDARIPIIKGGKILSPLTVRQQYAHPPA